MKGIEKGIQTQMGNSEQTLSQEIRAVIRQLWIGDITLGEYSLKMEELLFWGYNEAWNDGWDAVGGFFLPFLYTIPSVLATRDNKFALRFGEYIVENNKANGGKLSAFSYRIELWVNGYNKVRNLSMYHHGQGDVKLLWVRHSKDGCSTCVSMEGRVHRASTWRAKNMRPQGPNLACVMSAGGIPVCRCKFERTQQNEDIWV